MTREAPASQAQVDFSFERRWLLITQSGVQVSRQDDRVSDRLERLQQLLHLFLADSRCCPDFEMRRRHRQPALRQLGHVQRDD